ncbi:hypothetical protein [Chitinophaga flava]|uniref:DUF3592 domain-containing protein n=1 Tax=Chitinophaga flava TaxID=2259036 RepID=A0A365Y328_9BACT|nr:hypothetical protein [Chitinophaga flava]RBL92920.1 hypothetical protein DF182_10195 [Chitinophaga flava]
MNIRIVIWAILLILIIYLFGYQISVPAYHEDRLMVSLAGGLLTALCLVQTVRAYHVIPEKGDKNRRYILYFLWGAAAIVGSVVFYRISSQREEKLFAEHGVTTAGTIEGGIYRTHRGGATENIIVRFTTRDKKQLELYGYRAGEAGKPHYKDEPVGVVYLPEYPHIYRLVYDNSTRQ